MLANYRRIFASGQRGCNEIVMYEILSTEVLELSVVAALSTLIRISQE